MRKSGNRSQQELSFQRDLKEPVDNKMYLKRKDISFPGSIPGLESKLPYDKYYRCMKRDGSLKKEAEKAFNLSRKVGRAI